MAISPFSGPGMLPTYTGFQRPGVHFEGNKDQNQQAHAALQQAAREAGIQVDKALQREYHDYITGQGYEGFDALKEAAEELLSHKQQSGRRFSRFA